MKRIIEGKRYDTEKADLLAEVSSHEPRSSFGWWQEALYRTPRSGAYFLAGEGHARSRYATNLGGGSWGPGERIEPMSEDEAFAWAQRELPADQIEALFPDLIADA
jgi:hypothetical protein